MSRKNDITIMNAKLARYDERTKEAEDALHKLEKSRDALITKIQEEERKIRTRNLCNIGGLVYKYFGENLTPEDFQEMLDFLFAISEVQEFVNAEKEKRFQCDNSPTDILFANKSEILTDKNNENKHFKKSA